MKALFITSNLDDREDAEIRFRALDISDLELLGATNPSGLAHSGDPLKWHCLPEHGGDAEAWAWAEAVVIHESAHMDMRGFLQILAARPKKVILVSFEKPPFENLRAEGVEISWTPRPR